jgi:electron transport complex protein RnfG
MFPGYDESGKLVGIAIEAVGMGFADQLKVLYGYDPYDQKVIGFYVLESKETPGLGDKIEKDQKFLANFDALDVSLDEGGEEIKNMVVTVKNGKKVNAWEIDGITGATISSRAIGDIMASSTSHWMPLIQESVQTFENKASINDVEK